MVTADYVKEGAAVIDAGINRSAEGKLVGDVDFASVDRRLYHAGSERRRTDDD